MKRLLLIAAIALVLGTLLYQQIAAGSGYILIALGNTRIEMSFWTGVAIVLLAWFTLYVVYRLLRGSWRLLSGGASRIAQGNSRTVQQRTARGLVEYIEGNWKQSRKHLLKSATKSEYPLINYLAAAHSTFELGNHGEAADLLHKAEEAAPDSGLAVALTQARMLLAAKKYESCIANLERAKKIAPHHPVVLDLLQQVYVTLEDWRSLGQLLPDLRRHHVMSDSALETLEQKLHRALLQKAGARAQRTPESNAVEILKTEWQAVPARLRRQPEMVETYAHELTVLGDEEGAEVVLRKELDTHWHDRLVRLYGRVQGRDVKKQLLIAENWLKERPGDAALLLTLGRLCLRNAQWGRARDYFESSLKLQNHPETCAELARLLAHLGEHQKSTEYYQQGLRLTTGSLPELPMPGPTPLLAAAKA